VAIKKLFWMRYWAVRSFHSTDEGIFYFMGHIHIVLLAMGKICEPAGSVGNVSLDSYEV